ncbi:MAG: hypothetical protein HQL12_03670 [Candidatus Omnitrophica bacterium]|nr:hypothetical protein [Candidatus Omnitrophota bacterium]
MIAQVVFDLPLDGPFDYLIPEHLIPQVVPGTCVKVSFGNKTKIGFVVGILSQSTFTKLKPVMSLQDSSVVFSGLDLSFAHKFCAYYGCSLGEALGTMLRNKTDHSPCVCRDHKPMASLYCCRPDSYAVKIQEIIDGYTDSASLAGSLSSPRKRESCFLILAPDIFRSQTLALQLKGNCIFKIGMRSSVFECDGRYDCVIMVDEEDPSYKQESMPMYETRHVLLMRYEMYGFDIAFVGVSPSVELISMAREKQIKTTEKLDVSLPPAKVVDLSNYKFIPGLLSPPVRDALEAALKAGKKSILVLNRKGSYRLTRCIDCAEILKCSHCDSPLIYSRSEGKYLCRHCTYTAAGDTVCPKCHKPSWRSVGIGVEQLQAELKKYFPQAKILAFERTTKPAMKSPETKQSVFDFDILISTKAVLRFQGRWQAHMAAFIDFDAELNRLDMRSAFNAFSFALHISSMALEAVYIQTRKSPHYVLRSLSCGKTQVFYDEDLKLRRECGFSPFKHWIKISWRGKSEKSTHQAAWQVYNNLNQTVNYTVTPPLADEVGRKRDQFRFNVMVQANHVPQAMMFIKSTLASIKRHSRVIVSLNVDP